MEHWRLVQADLMRVYGVRDDQAENYSWPFYYSLVWSLPSIPDTACHQALFGDTA